MASVTIMIVDDEEGSRETVETAVTESLKGKCSLNFIHATSPSAARSMMDGRVKLVITDYRMGDELGSDLVVWLQEEFPDTRTILMSGDPEKPTHRANGFLAKPLNLHLLKQLLMQLLPIQP